VHSFLVKSRAFGVGLFCLVGAMTAGLSHEAAATTVDFENTGVFPVEGSLPPPLPDGYGGLHWDNLYISAGLSGTIGNFAVVNAGGYPGGFSSDVPIDLTSSYITAAWNNGLEILVTGFRNGVQLYSTHFTVDVGGPFLKVFNWEGVDSVRFAAAGGVSANPGDPGWGSGPILVMDNVTYQVATTPIPPALLLFGTALGGLAIAARRRKRAA